MNISQVVLAMVSLATLATLGDYFLKLASMESRILQNKWFIIGCIIYAASAFGWVFVLRHFKLAVVGVVFSLATVILLALLGVFVFGERLHTYEVVGIVFAIFSILLLSRFGI
jgi:multidrug transporter EmrE-like cation transporter